MEIIAGIELSAMLFGREVHVLGHFIDPTNAALAGLSRALMVERRSRMEQMVARLVAIGVPVTVAEVERFSGGENLGRPHLARALVERGWVANVKEAFDRFIGKGCPGFVERSELPAARAIALIHGAGGTATLAHPGVSKVVAHEVAELRAAGLDGLEAHHSDHNPSVRAKFLALAATHQLVATAGSDFHGEAVAPNRKLGSASMPPENLAQLRRLASARRSAP